MWVPTVALVVLFGAEIGLGAAGPRTWLPPLILIPLSLTALWWLGRIKLTVTADELRADDARLPLSVISDAIPLNREDLRLLLGPGSDPMAFVIQRPWIAGAVQIILDDPTDPTPYWILSTRSPEALAAALRS